ncbi:MAG: hypothetical protein ACYDHH_12605 [Solirubrobacteraceae bacterium]
MADGRTEATAGLPTGRSTRRDKILEAGREALAGKEERSDEGELRRKIGELERALIRARSKPRRGGSLPDIR